MVHHGFPEAFADGFLTLQAEAVGQLAFISGEVDEYSYERLSALTGWSGSSGATFRSAGWPRTVW
jgi:hypothetical protein